MKKNTTLCILTFLLVLFMSIITGCNKAASTPVPDLVMPVFSKEANESFIESITDNIDLNSGITMERAMPLGLNQVNNVTFAVFNHTEEPVTFSNQGFNLVAFRYIDNSWERMNLQFAPYSASRMLPPKLEKWDFEINNSWDVLENEIVALGSGQIRFYVSGQGTITNKSYGAYLDVIISEHP